MDKNKTFFETYSLPISATLISLNFTLDSVEKTISGKSVFKFLSSLELEKTVREYWKKSLRVEPTLHWEAIRFLKSRIYEGRS
ncbi:MAG: hypothetical protein Q7R97_03235 [Candidatus Daviesbacteria bacterium]|nr:hypothetical protein [Candidatus Daviesbacteria bacterium]